MPTTLKRANVKVKVNGQFQDLGLLQSDVATQLADEITTRQNKDTDLESNKIPYPQNPDSKYGNTSDVLRTDGAGHTKWVSIGDLITITAPNGKTYKLTVSNTGALGTEEI